MYFYYITSAPDGVSPGCKELLGKILVKDPTTRISLEKIMEHSWMNQGKGKDILNYDEPKLDTKHQNEISKSNTVFFISINNLIAKKK